MKTLLFIPVYNCEKQIPRVLKKVSYVINHFSKVILVDNRSNDKTIESAQNAIGKYSLMDIVSILVNDVNVSLGGSHKIAFNYAIKNNMDYIIVLHGDDQGDIEDYIKLEKRVDISKYGCLLGSRFMKRSNRKGYSFIRVAGNLILGAFCSTLVGRLIKDFGAGLNVYSTQVLRKSNYLNFPDDLTFNIFLLYEHFYDQVNYIYFPIHWVEEDQTSHAKVIRQALKITIFTLLFFLNRSMIKKIEDC